ncbi:MAG: alpha/beta hydrolase-fold protein [Pseudomonadota bacterium]
MGELITERFTFDGGRDVTLYVPSAPVQAILYCGDGQLLPHWGDDIERQDGLPSTMIVGVHRLADETLRLHEYSANFDPDRFAAHEEFVTGPLRAWVDATYAVNLPPDQCSVFGVSASGEFALAMGARHPDVFGVVLSASPGAGYKPSDGVIDKMPPTYLVAGRQEPFFLENATRWAMALRDCGQKVVLETRDAGHDDGMWRAELPKMMAWAFT